MSAAQRGSIGLGKARQSPLRREIAIALALKTVLLFGLWCAFFSEPLDQTLTSDQVRAAVLATHAPRGADAGSMTASNGAEKEGAR